MWRVRIALKRPYTFVVMAMLIAIMGPLSIVRMPTDIFPDIDIPVISVIWNYTGLSPEEMERRIVTNYERILTTTVNDIEHVESQSLTGIAVVKIYFQPEAVETRRVDVDHDLALLAAVRPPPRATSTPRSPPRTSSCPRARRRWAATSIRWC